MNIKAVSIIAILIFACSIMTAQAGDKYLFYMNGCCIEKVGTDGYETIAKKLEETGLKLDFTIRKEDTDEAVMGSVDSVVEKVNALLANGTPPEDITVSGFSLGSVIAMYASVRIANPKVNYVLLAGCPGPKARRHIHDYSKVQGRILSITDVGDSKFASCSDKITNASEFKEIKLESGKGHKVFRLPKDKFIELWKDPLVNWAHGK
jgi:alpha/beta superfamily hydrolase